MKRVIALLLVLSMALSLAGCASPEEKEAAKAVMALIEDLEGVTLEDAAAVMEAQEAYDDLTDKAKRRVKNYDVLETANADLAGIVSDMIDAIGTVTLDSEAAINAALEAYESIPEAAQDLVENYSDLEDADEELLSVFTAKVNDVTIAVETINSSINSYDIVTVVAMIEEILPTAEKVVSSKYFTNEENPAELMKDIQELMVQACYPNTRIITLDNFIKLDEVYNATASSNEGDSYNTESSTGMEYHSYYYRSATAMSNAFLAYTEYLKTYFELVDVEGDSNSARYIFVDELGRKFYVEWAYYNLGRYGTYNYIYVGFAPEIGLSSALSK